MNLFRQIHCDFCGLEFDPACQGRSCRGCPLSRGCAKIICPNCGYPLLPEPKLFTWLRALIKKIEVES